MSIDVDPLGGDVLWERAIPRFLELLDRHEVRATFFVVARECDRETPRRWIARIAAAGHELASHTLDHPRAFAALPRAALERQISEAEPRIADACGSRVVGFRAPAWDADVAQFECLERRGYAYDSSVCPTWLGPIARLAGRHRGVRPFGAAAFGGAPIAPYHPALRAPWRRGTMRLLEIPTSVGPMRAPIWHSALLACGPRAVAPLARELLRGPIPQWVFHAADLLDFDVDVDPALAYRPGLRRAIGEKLAMAEQVIQALSRTGHSWTTLAEVARAFA